MEAASVVLFGSAVVVVALPRTIDWLRNRDEIARVKERANEKPADVKSEFAVAWAKDQFARAPEEVSKPERGNWQIVEAMRMCARVLRI